MAKKKATVQQTAAKRVLDVLHRKEAYSESTAVGYEAFKNISYPTQVIAYTIANLMENGVVKRTQDERFYFDEQNWNQLKKKSQCRISGINWLAIDFIFNFLIRQICVIVSEKLSVYRV